MGRQWSLRLGPLAALGFFTVVNTLIYLDRGVISVRTMQVVLRNLASGEAMDLSESSSGALGSMFILGFMLSSPVFAYCAQYTSSTRLVAGGLLIWSLATLSAGLAPKYWVLVIARAATGIGEASFICLAPPLILDSAPPTKKTVRRNQLWVSVFFSAMTLGYALGFVYGHEVMTVTGSWRWPFVIESAAMVPLIVIAFLLHLDTDTVHLEAAEQRMSLWGQLGRLAKNPVFLLIVAGYSAYAFTIGGLAFWGNSIIQETYGVSARVAVVSLGSLTVFCGVVATVLGSLYMDYELASRPGIDHFTESQIQALRTNVACRFAFYSITSGAVIGLIGAFFRSYVFFISALGMSEFLLFLCELCRGTGPVGMALMSCVPAELRGQANAVAVFLMHLLGDFPSPYVIGLINQFIGMKWGIVVLVSWLFCGSAAWGVAWLMAVFPTQNRPLEVTKGEGEVEEETLMSTSA